MKGLEKARKNEKAREEEKLKQKNSEEVEERSHRHHETKADDLGVPHKECHGHESSRSHRALSSGERWELKEKNYKLKEAKEKRKKIQGKLTSGIACLMLQKKKSQSPIKK